MTAQLPRTFCVALCLSVLAICRAQDAAPPNNAEPKGVEVLARGPVHEAFANPSVEPRPTPMIQKKPPTAIEEMAPEERPEGDVVWIGGYWAYDDDRRDFLWVSGCWRTKPASREWVPGYWRDVDGQFQWVPGFWTAAQEDPQQQKQLTYFPQPPAPPQIAPPGPPPADEFYVPGYWVWHGDHYVWRAGYFTRVRPGYVYVASHYRWTPGGYVYIPGYWDYDVSRRGLLYAPVIVDPAVVGPTFVYTPRYAVNDALVVDAFFVRPATCHYYFGDYYGPGYVTLGYEPCVVYSRRYYEPIIVYRQWEYRAQPRWLEVQIVLHNDRALGRAPLPPRTLVQQNTIIQNNVTVNNVTVNNTTVNHPAPAPGLAPARSVLASRGQTAVPLDTAARAQVKQTSVNVQQSTSAGRQISEQPTTSPNTKPRVAAFNVPAAAPAPWQIAPAALNNPAMSKTAPPIGANQLAPKQSQFVPKQPLTPPSTTPQPFIGATNNPPLPPVKPVQPNAVTSVPQTPTTSPPGLPPGSPPKTAGMQTGPPSLPPRPAVQPPPNRPAPPPRRDDDRKKGP